MTRFYVLSQNTSLVGFAHEFFTDRGWELDEWNKSHANDQGYPTECDALFEPVWVYSESFDGTSMNQFDDVTPRGLTARIRVSGFNGEESHVVVGTAGNDKGCAKHATDEYMMAVKGSSFDAVELNELLDELELKAKYQSPRDLVECLFFGECGRPRNTR